MWLALHCDITVNIKHLLDDKLAWDCLSANSACRVINLYIYFLNTDIVPL
jgi:hypothetical protein